MKISWAAAAMFCSLTPIACGQSGTRASSTQATLTLMLEGAGTVLAADGSFECRGQSCARAFAAGTRLQLRAIPDARFRFEGWKGACARTGSCDVVLDHDLTVTATFALETQPPTGKHALTVVRAGGGTVRSVPDGIDCGTTCSAVFDDGATVSLLPAAQVGWSFAGWGGGACTGPGSCSVALTKDVTVYATFTSSGGSSTRALSVLLGGSGKGRVASTPAGIDCGATCTASFPVNSSVVLAPSPEGGSRFAGWGGACSGSEGCTVTLANDASVTAAFEPSASADECAGLLPPTPGTPVGFRVEESQSGSMRRTMCVPGTSNGAGTLALEYVNTFQPHDAHVSFVDPAGRLLRNGGGSNLEMFDQLDGFLGISRLGSIGQFWQADQFDRQGTVLRSRFASGTDPVVVASDPKGGIVVLSIGQAGRPSKVSAYAADGTLRFERAPPADIASGATLGVDRQGNTLFLFDGAAQFGTGTAGGRWMDGAGNFGEAFKAFEAAFPRSATLHPQVGSGLFAQVGEAPNQHRWVAAFASLSTTPTPPPEWLASRPETRIHMAHGGTAYALLPLPQQTVAPCAQRIEIVAPSGKSCGTATFAIDSASCTTQSIDVGYDGTVIQQFPSDRELPPHVPPSYTCTWQFWPGYLR